MLRRMLVPAALLATVALPASALDGFEVYRNARPHMLQLVGVSATGRYHVGSGVALPNGTVVTNCHVTLQARRVQLFLGGSGQSAALEAATVAHDLCALYFPELKREGATLGATRDLSLGDPVYAVGYNAGKGLTYQPGKIEELYEHEGGMVIRTTAAFTHGASGGGLFDRSGRLVGILTFFRVSKDKTDYFAVPVEWLKDLEDVPAQAVAPLEGVPFWADQMGRQPAFLQAGALEADERWDELADLRARLDRYHPPRCPRLAGAGQGRRHARQRSAGERGVPARRGAGRDAHAAPHRSAKLALLRLTHHAGSGTFRCLFFWGRQLPPRVARGLRYARRRAAVRGRSRRRTAAPPVRRDLRRVDSLTDPSLRACRHASRCGSLARSLSARS